MGYKFFTSTTKELQREIRQLKRLSNTDIDSALQYCVLASLMFETSSEDRFGEEISKVLGEDYYNVNRIKNVNGSVIGYLCHSLFEKKVTITTGDLMDTCIKLSDKYIKKTM